MFPKGGKYMWIRLKQAVAVALHLAAVTEKPTAEMESKIAGLE